MTTFPVAPLNASWLPPVEKPTSPAWAKRFIQLRRGAGAARDQRPLSTYVTSHLLCRHLWLRPCTPLHLFTHFHHVTSCKKWESTMSFCFISPAIFQSRGRIKWIEAAFSLLLCPVWLLVKFICLHLCTFFVCFCCLWRLGSKSWQNNEVQGVVSIIWGHFEIRVV